MAALRGLAALALVLAATIATLDLLRGLGGGAWSATSLDQVWRAIDQRGPAPLVQGLGPWLGGIVEGAAALPAAGLFFVFAAILFLIGRRRDRHQIPIMR